MNGRAVEAALMLNIPRCDDVSEARMQLILIALAGHASWTDGKCWPKVATIAGLARCAESTVRLALQHLRECGVITRVKKPTPRDSAVWRMGPWYVPMGADGKGVPKPGGQSAETRHSRVPSSGTEQGSTRSEHVLASLPEPEKPSPKELRERMAAVKAAARGSPKPRSKAARSA